MKIIKCCHNYDICIKHSDFFIKEQIAKLVLKFLLAFKKSITETF